MRRFRHSRAGKFKDSLKYGQCHLPTAPASIRRAWPLAARLYVSICRLNCSSIYPSRPPLRHPLDARRGTHLRPWWSLQSAGSVQNPGLIFSGALGVAIHREINISDKRISGARRFARQKKRLCWSCFLEEGRLAEPRRTGQAVRRVFRFLFSVARPPSFHFGGKAGCPCQLILPNSICARIP